MSSGIYAALSGAVARTQLLENISNNLSNLHTAGFKRDRLSFAAMLDDASQTRRTAGVNLNAVAESRTDFRHGTLAKTNNDFDVAINGDGFFRLRSADGSLYYSRQGTFARALDGRLINRAGDEVLSVDNNPIVLPDGAFRIDEDGRVLAAEGQIGQIGLFDPDSAQLTKVGESRFAFSGDEAAVGPAAGSQVQQGYLEQSNVNSMEEMAQLISNLRNFEAYQKAMKNYHELSIKVHEIAAF